MKKLIVTILFLIAYTAFAGWEECNEGIYGGISRAVMVKGDIVYAGTDAGSIFTSLDKAETWLMKFTNAHNNPIQRFAANDDFVFAGTFGGGVFRSSDNGETWETKNKGLIHQAINCFAFHEDNIYLGTFTDGLYFSDDAGDNWQFLGFDSSNVTVVEVFKDRYFAGVWGEGIYISDDKGQNWTISNSGLPESYNLSFNSYEGDIILGTWRNGIYRSSDLGETWTESNSGMNNIYIWSIQKQDDILYASTEGGVYKSDDGGHNWVHLGMSGIDIRSLSVDGEDIYAGTLFGGVYYSSNTGIDWHERSAGIANASLKCVNSNDEVIWAGALGLGVYLSTDNGNSWINKGLDNLFINGIDFDGVNIFVATNKGVFYSSNNGDTWETKNNGIEHLYINNILFRDGIIYIATHGESVFYSNDMGNTWIATTVITGQNLYAKCTEIYGNTLISGTNSGIYISEDMGVTWTQAYWSLSGGNDVRSITISGENIYATAYNSGILKSTDGGKKWKHIRKGLNNDFARLTYSITSYDKYLFLGTGREVYISDDEGESWTAYNENMAQVATNGLTVSGQYIFAGTNGAGMYRRLLPTSSVRQSNATNLFIYPNPAVDYIEVNQTSKGSEIRIFNVMGLEVLSESIHPMSLRHRMYVEHLPAGVYFVRIGEHVSMFVKQ